MPEIPHGQTEPSADMRQAAAALWQMYVALTKEGFSSAQAMQIIGTALATMLGEEGD